VQDWEIFQKESKRNGSTSVILITQANKDPAPDHLHGPTTIWFFLARRTKSATIRKYELNHISLITLSSYSKRLIYSERVNSQIVISWCSCKNFFLNFVYVCVVISLSSVGLISGKDLVTTHWLEIFVISKTVSLSRQRLNLWFNHLYAR
jgi:hypothetical protein